MNTTRALTLASVALIAAGCGSSKPPASAGRGANGPAAAAYKYARCMRGHGVASFPDPRVSVSPGRTTVAVMAPQSAVASPRFKTAERACQKILGAPGSQGRSDQLAHKPALLAFAHCMRARGISDFPDPNPQGQITREMLSAAGVDLHSHVLLRAALACVRVTHGAVTAAQVEAAVSNPH
jgi:hypothetical protein